MMQKQNKAMLYCIGKAMSLMAILGFVSLSAIVIIEPSFSLLVFKKS
jgi:hypothetical protein